MPCVCRQVVGMVKQRYPQSELLAAGWSLGANILVRYLGEEGAASPISAAVSMCNPFDLVSLVSNMGCCSSAPGQPCLIGHLSCHAHEQHLSQGSPCDLPGWCK